MRILPQERQKTVKVTYRVIKRKQYLSPYEISPFSTPLHITTTIATARLARYEFSMIYVRGRTTVWGWCRVIGSGGAVMGAAETVGDEQCSLWNEFFFARRHISSPTDKKWSPQDRFIAIRIYVLAQLLNKNHPTTIYCKQIWFTTLRKLNSDVKIWNVLLI